MALPLEIIIKATDQASGAINAVKDAIGGTGTKGLSGAMQATGKSMMKTGAVMTGAISTPIVAMGAKMATVAGDFEAQMNVLTLAAGDVGPGMDALRQAAIKTGADTSLVGINASQSAEALTNFYKAGLDTAGIFGGEGGLNAYLTDAGELSGALRAAIDLQAASELDLAQAADLVAISMATFGIGAEEATRITDNFVQAADASVTAVPELAEAMKNIGPTAAAFGFSLEDTNNALAILSQRGITGGEAGTALKSMMTNLMRPTDAVTGMLKALNVELYDSDGAMKSLPDIVNQLSTALGEEAVVVEHISSLTGEQAEDFGKLKDAQKKVQDQMDDYRLGVKGATLSDEERVKKIQELYTEYSRLSALTRPYIDQAMESEKVTRAMTEAEKNNATIALAGTYGMKAMQTLMAEGTEGWVAMETATSSAAATSEVAAARTQGMNGAMEALSGTIETFMIQAGTPLIETLTKIVTAITPIIEKFAMMDSSTLAIIVSVVAAVAAIGPLVTIFGGLLTALGLLASPIGIVVAAVALLTAKWVEAQGGIGPAIDVLMEKFNAIKDTITTLITAMEGMSLSEAISFIVDTAVTWWETDGATKAAEIWAGLKGMLDTAWQYLVTEGPTIAANIWAKLSPVLTSAWAFISTNAVTIASNLWAKLKEALAAAWQYLVTEGPTIAANIWAKLEPLLATAWEFISTNAATIGATIWTKLKGLLAKAWEYLVTEGPTIASEIWTKLKGLLATAWQYLVTEGPTIAAEIWTKLNSLLTTAWGFIATNAGPIAADLGAKLGSVVSGAWDWLTTNIGTAVGNVQQKVMAAIFGGGETGGGGDAAANAEAAGQNIGMKIGSAIRTGITWLVQNVGPYATALWEGLKAIVAAAFLKLSGGETGQEGGEAAAFNVGEFIGNLMSIGPKIVVGAAALLFAGLKSVVVAAIKLVQETDWSTVLTDIGGFIKGLFSGSTGETQKTDVVAIILAFFSGVIAGFVSGLTGTTISGADLLTSINKFITDNITKPFEDIDLLQIGKDMITGLADGIAERADTYLKEKAQGVANLLPGWVKKILGIESPSTVFADIGRQTMAGMELGIDERAPAVLDATSQVATNLYGPIEQAAPKLDDAFAPILTIFDRVVSWLTSFAANLPDSTDMQGQAEIFEDFGDGFDSMAKALKNFVGIGMDMASGKITDAVLDALAVRYKDFVIYVVEFVEDIVETLGGAKWGVKRIKEAKKQMDRFGAIIDGFLRDFEQLKEPPTTAEVEGYAEAMKYFIVKMIDLVDWISLDVKYDGLGISVEKMKELAMWAKMLAGFFVLTGMNLKDVESADLPDYAAAVTKYVEQLITFVTTVATGLAGLDEKTTTALADAAAVSGDVSSLLGILGHDLTIKMPELEEGADWTVLLANWLKMIQHASGTIFGWLKTIEEDTAKELELAAPIAGNISSVLGILSTSLKFEAPEAGWAKGIAKFFDGLDIALRAAMTELDEIGKKWSTEALESAGKAADAVQKVLGILGIDFWKGGEGLGFAESHSILKDEMGWLLDDIALAVDMVMDPDTGLPAIQAKWGDALETASGTGELIKKVFDALAGATKSASEALKTGLDATAIERLMADFQRVATASASLGNMQFAPNYNAPATPPGATRDPGPTGMGGMEITMSLEIYSPQLDEVLTLIDGHASAQSATGEQFSIKLRPDASAKSV